MDQSPNNPGDASGQRLTCFGDVVLRAAARAGGITALSRETGICEQNLRRWGDRGEWPSLRVLFDTRRCWPLPMLIDFTAWFYTGLPLVMTPTPTPAVHSDATLMSLALGVERLAVDLAETVELAQRDGRVTSEEAARILMRVADARQGIECVATAAQRRRTP